MRSTATLSVPVEQLRDDDDLFAAGLVSFDLINLMICLEVSCGIEFPPEAMNRQSFSTIGNIAAALAALKARAPEA